MDKKEDKNNLLNDSNFQEEGEYILNQKPKYKYEIRIIHDPSQEKAKMKSKTPEKIISSSKFSIINKPKKAPIKQNQNKNKYNNNYYNKNKIYNNSNNLKHYDNFNNYNNYSVYEHNDDFGNNGNYEHYDNFNNNNNYCFYDSKTTKRKQDIINYSKEPTPQSDFLSNTSDNFYNSRNYIKHKYEKNEFIYDENFNYCECQKEFNQLIQKYFMRGKKIKQNHCKNYNNYNDYNFKNRRENNITYRNIKDYSNQNSKRKRVFKTPLKIQKSIDKTFGSNEYEEENEVYNIKQTKINNINDYDDDRIIDNNSSSIRNMKYSNLNIYNDNNIYSKNISQNLNKNKYLYIKNQKKKFPKQNNKKTNYSFLSIDDSKNKNGSPYNKNNSKKDKNIIKLYNENNYNSNNQLMIHKSSERKEKIKSIPKGQKIKPLIIKKSVKKPIIETIKKDDGSIVNVMKQTTILTSIETKPINNLSSQNNKNENFVKERITSIYTTLTKNIEENENKTLTKNKSLDDLNKKKEKQEKNGIFTKRKIMDKNIKNNNFHHNDNLDIITQKEICYNNKNENNNLKNNYNIDISEISNDLLKNRTMNSSINYGSLISYEQIEPNNNVIRINEEIKYIKYLYYRCTNLNSENQAKNQTLSNYFLKLSDEEKIAILTNLNDGEPENKKIYNKLINILKEKRLNDENSLNNTSKNLGDIVISDCDEEDNNKKKNNVPPNILFKKKKITK